MNHFEEYCTKGCIVWYPAVRGTTLALCLSISNCILVSEAKNQNRMPGMLHLAAVEIIHVSWKVSPPSSLIILLISQAFLPSTRRLNPWKIHVKRYPAASNPLVENWFPENEAHASLKLIIMRIEPKTAVRILKALDAFQVSSIFMFTRYLWHDSGTKWIPSSDPLMDQRK